MNQLFEVLLEDKHIWVVAPSESKVKSYIKKNIITQKGSTFTINNVTTDHLEEEGLQSLLDKKGYVGKVLQKMFMLSTCVEMNTKPHNNCFWESV